MGVRLGLPIACRSCQPGKSRPIRRLHQRHLRPSLGGVEPSSADFLVQSDNLSIGGWDKKIGPVTGCICAPGGWTHSRCIRETSLLIPATRRPFVHSRRYVLTEFGMQTSWLAQGGRASRHGTSGLSQSDYQRSNELLPEFGRGELPDDQRTRTCGDQWLVFR